MLFTKNDPHAVLDYFDMVLAFSNYPPSFPQSYEIDYEAEERVLVIDYLLPPLKALPRLRAVNYDKDSDSFYESIVSEEERDQQYARLLQEMPLRTFFEIYASDKTEVIAAVQFKGYLYLQQDAKSGGMPSCVLAVRADREAFKAMDLAEHDSLDVFTELGWHDTGYRIITCHEKAGYKMASVGRSVVHSYNSGRFRESRYFESA